MKRYFILLGLIFAVASDSRGVTAVPGQTVTFTATADGTQPFSYQWYKGGIGGRLIVGATSQTYVIVGVRAIDGDSYQCVVWNKANSETNHPASNVVSLDIAIPVPVVPAQNVKAEAAVR